jgi:hypothetical protein
MKRFIQEYLLENWSLKATAVLLSLILWLSVRGEPGVITEVSASLEIQVPRLMEITNDRPMNVYVTMLTMRGAPQPHPICIINLQKANEGKNIITLNEDNVRLPGGARIEVQQINPARITLILERTISKEVPIIVPVSGEPAKGFEIYGRSPKPSTVVLTGPYSKIKKIKEITTEALSIRDMQQSSRFFVSLNIDDNAVRTSLTTPIQVDVQIGPCRKVFTVNNVLLVVDDESYAASPKYISARIIAPVGSTIDFKPADFIATVVTQNLNMLQEPARIKPQVRLLNNRNETVAIKEVLPAEVFVRRKPAVK